jgi:hypothetical protein
MSDVFVLPPQLYFKREKETRIWTGGFLLLVIFIDEKIWSWIFFVIGCW